METRDVYKARQEAFVTDLHGTEVGALLGAVSLLPLAHAFLQGVAVLVDQRSGRARFSPRVAAVLRFATEFGVLCAACLATVSLPPWPVVKLLASLTAAVWFAVSFRGCKPPQLNADLLRSAVSAYRGSIMLLTCVAILGVDFPLFSRAHAKTEAYGASLMDLGVGAVVTASAMTVRVGGTGRGEGLPARLLSSLSAVAIPSLLGAARLFTHSAVKYQHHVSEYGLHWNFYWTVSSIALLMACAEVGVGLATSAVVWASKALRSADVKQRKSWGMCLPRLLRTSHPSAPYVAAALALALSYQVALRWLLPTPFDLMPGCMEGLQEPPACAGATAAAAARGASFLAPPHTLEAFILCAPRFPGGFWAANREGVASTLGFLALHLLGLAAGRTIAAARAGEAPSLPGQAASAGALGRTSLRVAAVAWCAYLTLTDPRALAVPGLRSLLAFVGPSPPSRRLANAPFVALSVAMNATQMGVYIAVAAMTARAYEQWRRTCVGTPEAGARRAASPRGRAGSRPRRVYEPSLRQAAAAASPPPAPAPSSTVGGPSLLEAINAVFFPVFLLANLQTGVVNATMKTLDVRDAAGAGVLVLHTLSLCAFAAGCAAVGWRPRLKL